VAPGKVERVYAESVAGSVRVDVGVQDYELGLIGTKVAVAMDLGRRAAILIPARFVRTQYGLDTVELRASSPDSGPAAITVQLAPGPTADQREVIAGLSVGFGRSLSGRGLAANRGFAGVSPFDPGRDFATDFRRFLLAPGPAHLVMVHPGGPDDTELARLDPVVATRPQEFSYLSGPNLLEDLAEARMRIIRLGDLT
jgi:hypothetical protein